MLWNRTSELAMPFRQKLEALVLEISKKERKKFVLVRENGAYYAVRDYNKNPPKTKRAKRGYIFKMRGDEDENTGKVEIEAEVREAYKLLVRRYMAAFFRENGAKRYKVDL